MKTKFYALACLLVALLLSPLMASAQMGELPVDPEVRIGKLPNGLTYYIRHNEYPKGQADFYIAQKVGSILEEDNQRGLAHFLEHMCFNGTTNFPEKNIINWLESVGVKFGYNLNAYTSVDETVYNISNVPVARQSVQDSCLLILHDWANDLTLSDEEIDAERAVIHEEWRRSMVGQMRILENLLPVIYPGSRYGYRLPIGTMEVVDNFPYQALRDYYETWYRPDQQGIIVVGDIDPDYIESKIVEMFSPIEMPENAPERVYFPVPDNEETIYAIGSDPEQKNAIAELFIKSEAFPDSLKNTAASYVQDFVMNMITSMLNTRLNDLSSTPDAPFANASVDYDNFFLSKTADALTLSALDKGGDLPSSLAAAYRELLRAQRGGFTVSEYDRAKAEYLSRIEKIYNNRNQQENGTYVREYVRSFIDGDPIPGIELEWQLIQMLAQAIPLQAINETVAQLVTPDNRIVLALLPETEGYVIPTAEQFAAALAAVDAEDIEAYQEELKDEPLIPALPAPGSIVATKELSQFDAIEWTLSNGVRVIVKPTKFKDDEILFTAAAINGTSVIDESLANSLIFMDAALSQSGLGTYSNSDLQKYLAGKQVNVSPSFDEFTRTISGNTTPKDLPTLMELIYMTFTDIEFTEDEFRALQNLFVSVLHNQEADPTYIFQKKMLDALYNSPRVKIISTEVVEGADRAAIIDIAHQMTANAAEYVFVFVGNINLDTLRPLVEQYIATLPADAAKARKNVTFSEDLAIKKGPETVNFDTPMQTPQTMAAILEWGDMPYTAKNALLASVAGQILSKRLIDIVREKEGAVYSISATGSMGRISANPIVIQSVFPMKPELKERVLEIIAEQFADMESNVNAEELAKVKEFMVKDFNEDLELNNGWIAWLRGWSLNNVDSVNGMLDTINGLTVDDVQNFMKALNAQRNYKVIIQNPAE